MDDKFQELTLEWCIRGIVNTKVGLSSVILKFTHACVHHLGAQVHVSAVASIWHADQNTALS